MGKPFAAVKSLPTDSWKKWTVSLWTEVRPHQWSKNLVVFAPLFFSKNLTNSAAVKDASIACVLFCIVSSSVYLLNDIKDKERDRVHPQKRYRPIAAGEIRSKTALAVMGLLLVLAVGSAATVRAELAFILIVYWLINFLYSVWLKHEVILDVFALAAGFLLRVAGGAIAIQVQMSHWLLLCTMLLALFLGLSKRRYELVILGDSATSHRDVLGHYSTHFLDMMIAIVTASTLVSYALYTVSEETVNRFQTEALLLTLPFVVYGIFRYLYLIYHKNGGGNPGHDLFVDPHMIIDICLWATVTGVIIYWK
jgi:4-hydroxybenzoate polyprenyltransferase